MHHRKKDPQVGSCIASELIGHELPRRLARMFQCSGKESFSGSRVSARSDQNFNDVPIPIYVDSITPLSLKPA